MHRDYRFAMYALGISAVLLVASGAVVTTGASLSSGPTDNPGNKTNITKLDTDHPQQVNKTLTQTENGTYTLQQAHRTCSGVLRLNSSDRNSTTHQVRDVTVTLVSHHDSAKIDEIGRQRLAELVVEATDDRAGLGEYSQLEVQVNQYYESTARDEPLDTAGIHVRPADDCLPSVRGTVDLTNETVDVRTARPDIEAVSLNYTNEIGALDQNERELIERLVVADRQTSYNVRTHLDATALQATVTEATADGHVDIKLRRPDRNGSTVMLTVDLDAETVVHSWAVIQIDESDMEVVEVQNASRIDVDESNVTVVNSTSR